MHFRFEIGDFKGETQRRATKEMMIGRKNLPKKTGSGMFAMQRPAFLDSTRLQKAEADLLMSAKLVRNNLEEKSRPEGKDAIGNALACTLLASEGQELKKGVWERCVSLGADGFVYQIEPIQTRGALKIKMVAKRKVGDYLRWVDGLFAPGELPA